MRNSKFSFRIVVVLILAVSLGILFLWKQAIPIDRALEDDDLLEQSSAAIGNITLLNNELQLQIPLEETVAERSRLMTELAERNSFYLRDIYEKYLALVGANGLIASVHTVYPLCHDRGHDLGKVIYEELGNIGTALRTCEDACFSGCMHGVLMENFAAKEPEEHKHAAEELESHPHITLEDVEEQIATICENPDVLGLYKTGDCVHGVGHAMMYLSNYDIPKALEYCSLFESDPLDYYCSTGAFMEYVVNFDVKDNETKSLFYPCDQSGFPAACFRYKLGYVVQRYFDEGKQMKEIIEGCLKLEGKYRLGCFHGVGNGLVGPIESDQVDFEDVCRYGTKDDQYMCIEGAIERMAKYYPKTAKLQCNDLTGWQKDLCLEGADRQMYSLEKSFDLYLQDR